MTIATTIAENSAFTFAAILAFGLLLRFGFHRPVNWRFFVLFAFVVSVTDAVQLLWSIPDLTVILFLMAMLLAIVLAHQLRKRHLARHNAQP